MIARVSAFTRYKAEFKDDAEFECLAEDTKPLDLSLPHNAQIALTGLIISSEIERNQWEQIGAKLGKMSTGVQWALGDWIAFGERRFKLSKSAVTKIAKKVGYTFDSLMNLASVSRKVDRSLRNERLSYSHHVAVAALEQKEQEQFLSKAAQEGWSIKQLREEINKDREPSFPEKTPEQVANYWLEDFETWANVQPRFSLFNVRAHPHDMLVLLDDGRFERLVEISDGATQRWSSWSQQLKKYQRDRDNSRTQQAAE